MILQEHQLSTWNQLAVAIAASVHVSDFAGLEWVHPAFWPRPLPAPDAKCLGKIFRAGAVNVIHVDALGFPHKWINMLLIAPNSLRGAARKWP